MGHSQKFIFIIYHSPFFCTRLATACKYSIEQGIRKDKKGGHMNKLTEADKVRIEATVILDADKAEKQIDELISLLEKANSLADELALTLRDLKLDIKV